MRNKEVTLPLSGISLMAEGRKIRIKFSCDFVTNNNTHKEELEDETHS